MLEFMICVCFKRINIDYWLQKSQRKTKQQNLSHKNFSDIATFRNIAASNNKNKQNINREQTP